MKNTERHPKIYSNYKTAENYFTNKWGLSLFGADFNFNDLTEKQIQRFAVIVDGYLEDVKAEERGVF